MSKSSDKHVTGKGVDYNGVLTGMVELLDAARRASARVVNSLMTATYWEMGRRIVEHEQRGQHRAGYGEELLARLSTDLTKRFGRGFSVDNLERARKFFLTFTSVKKSATTLRISAPTGLTPISATALRKSQGGEMIEWLRDIAARFPLPWSHYTRLLRLRSAFAVEFYHTEAVRGGWTVKQLERQMNSQFYERTALSRNKAGMLVKGQRRLPEDKVSADEEIRSPFLLEFLGLKDEYSESDLEAALILHLEKFLLELGNDFAFVGRQRRLRIGHEWFRVDLLLFHRRLRCLVIIDLLCGRPHNRSSVADFIMWPCQRKSRAFGETKVWRRHIRRDYRLRRNSIKSLSSRHFTRDVVRPTSQRANALAFISKSTSA